jgi:ADP-ribosylglycohydrolase
LASDKTEVSAGHSSRGRLKIENVARDIRGPEIEKSPASVAVKAAPITCTLEFARVISTLGGMRGGTCFDIGNTTREALIRFERTGDPVAGSTDPQSAGNGSLMRLAPAAIRHYADFARAIEVARRQSVTTHAAAASVDACAFFAELLVRALNGVDRAALFFLRGFSGHPEIAAIATGRYLNKKRDEIEASGYVVHTLEAALWCVHRSTDFRQAVLLAANLGEDADAVAAVTGQLAGAMWGERGIPEDWRAKLAWRDRIRDRAVRLFELGTTAADLVARESSALGKIAVGVDNAQAGPRLSGNKECSVDW